ncbi:MAG: cyclase family protein [Nitrospirota bacterium]
MRKIYDITMGIKNGMLTYPGDPGVEIKREKEIGKNSQANLSMYCIGSHTGTHLDPPFHFFPDGDTAESLPLDSLIGPAVVVEAPDEIGRDFLAGAGLEGAERVLLKTKNSAFAQDPAFREDFAHLTPDGAEYLAELGVKLVGIDYLSIEKYHSKEHAVHRLFLGKGIVILEGLDLSNVEPGEYTLLCLPLKVIGGDGAPARAVLIKE